MSNISVYILTKKKCYEKNKNKKKNKFTKKNLYVTKQRKNKTVHRKSLSYKR